ncbi:hypothetical protein BJ165DRAFT_1417428 [Panaeolus papilionaceus]|nr:hypothetical protein BJ165DRAFT_1417428 [Panaeolus papilionaceus]
MSDDSDLTKNANNSKGRNQYRSIAILDAIPDLAERLQKYSDQGVLRKDIPRMIEKDCNETISLASVKKFMRRFNIRTVRRNTMSDLEKGVAILDVIEQDPLGRLGCRNVKEKLALTGVHISRDFTMQFLKAENPSLTANRHPQTRKIHKHTLWSSGPNEEWCLDGHEKILLSMGIVVYGIIDKFSRMELSLIAVPNARDSALPIVVYLRAMKEYGGMPLSSTSDKGSEVGQLISLVQTLRKRYQPYISEDEVPSHSAVKSTANITRERGWRPIWEKSLANTLHFYRTGQGAAGYHASDNFHVSLALWVWSKVVQRQLNELLIENRYHRIRGQLKTLLPSNARHIDIYTSPEEFGATNKLIPIPSADVDELLKEYDDLTLFQFVSSELDVLFEEVYSAVGTPVMAPSTGWQVFYQMITYHIATLTT